MKRLTLPGLMRIGPNQTESYQAIFVPTGTVYEYPLLIWFLEYHSLPGAKMNLPIKRLL